MLSEQEKQQVKEEAWQIMNKFAKALEKVESEVKNIEIKEVEEGEREERNGLQCENEFRELMFKNAPKKNNDCIIAEKGEWT